MYYSLDSVKQWVTKDIKNEFEWTGWSIWNIIIMWEQKRCHLKCCHDLKLLLTWVLCAKVYICHKTYIFVCTRFTGLIQLQHKFTCLLLSAEIRSLILYFLICRMCVNIQCINFIICDVKDRIGHMLKITCCLQN